VCCRCRGDNRSSQAARPAGLSRVNGVTVVELKHETSTLRETHYSISIALTFGMGDHVREVTSPAEFGLDPMSGQDAT